MALFETVSMQLLHYFPAKCYQEVVFSYPLEAKVNIPHWEDYEEKELQCGSEDLDIDH